MTSCGLNGVPLRGRGVYGARIACNLWSAEGCGRYDGSSPAKRLKAHPYFTQDEKDGDKTARQYIANMRDGAVAGFKYFSLWRLEQIAVHVRGNAEGCMEVAADEGFEKLIDHAIHHKSRSKHSRDRSSGECHPQTSSPVPSQARCGSCPARSFFENEEWMKNVTSGDYQKYYDEMYSNANP